MDSAGNDIVALAAIDAERTRQPNFYSRIITPAEREFYLLHLEEQLAFEHFVWLAWSVKESAYKFLKRFEPQLVFSPSKMHLNELSFTGENFGGTIHSGDQRLYSRSFVSRDYIFSIVNGEKDFSDVHCGIAQIAFDEPGEQSRAVRELLMHNLRQLFPESDLHFTKSPHGWPIVVNDDRELPVPVSFAHHGHFVAYTYQSNLASWKAHRHRAEIL